MGQREEAPPEKLSSELTCIQAFLVSQCRSFDTAFSRLPRLLHQSYFQNR